jgi:L-threonylcarbamoyladenylate synthase
MTELDFSKAIAALSNGEVIVYPTDTLYGLGADIFNEPAVKKIFDIKNRPLDDPLSVAVSNYEDLEKIAFLDDKTRSLIDAFLPGSLTLILKKKKVVSDIVTGGLDKVAIRIPDNKIALKLLSEFGPLTATSANVHGKETPSVISDINMQFKDKVAVYLDDGRIAGKPSTIIEIVGEELKILREGAIPKEKILDEI